MHHRPHMKSESQMRTFPHGQAQPEPASPQLPSPSRLHSSVMGWLAVPQHLQMVPHRSHLPPPPLSLRQRQQL
jgi:hypothetical protein